MSDTSPDAHVLPDLDEFLATAEDPHDWVLPGIVEAGDRVIVTGPEGGGKSTLLRQVAVQAAVGIHPFTLEPLDQPVPVLVIDTENSARQIRRALRKLRPLAGDHYQAGQLRLDVVGHPLELARPQVYADVAAKVNTYRPRLIVIGPLYKLTDGDPVKEEPARDLAAALDHLRALSGAAMLIEAHTPYADGSRSRRPRRPYGASLWSRWPEFGIYLSPEGDLEHWRGQRDERDWPTGLQRGGAWPWTTRCRVEDQAPAWDGPTHCMAAVRRWLEDHPDDELSKRAMAEKLRGLGLSYRASTVAASLERLAAAGDIGHRRGPRNADLYRAQGTEHLEF